MNPKGKVVCGTLKEYIRVGGVFPALCLVLVVQVSLFHWSIFHNLLVSSLWRHPIEFFAFWWPKVGACLLVASLACLSRHKWWTVSLPVLTGLWATANYVYYRANGFLLSFEAMLMGDGLAGFWHSAFSYFDFTAIAFLLMAVAYALVLIPIRPPRRQPKVFLVVVLLVVLLHLPSAYHNNRLYGYTTERHVQWIDLNPWFQTVVFQRDYHYGFLWIDVAYFDHAPYHLKQYSLLHYFVNVVVSHEADRYYTRHLKEMLREDAGHCPAMPSEVRRRLLHPTEADTVPQANLVLLLVESLESWVVEANDRQGCPIAPNLRRLSSQGLYCPYVRSQVRHGVSGDGQMIINTGLLPISYGAACRLYADNTWPGWASLFARSATIIPTNADAWNQAEVTPAYGYQSLYAVKDKWLDDIEVMDCVARCADTISTSPFAIQALTIGTHTPFVQSHPSSLELDGLPKSLQGYLHCVHYADSCIGVLLGEADTSNTLVVITGDHTIFKQSVIEEYQPFASAYGFGIASGHNFVPLYVVGGHTMPMVIQDTCYQMDIYPTLMHAIGCGGYWWKGFGRDLLDTASRPFTEEEAYRYSDIIIKTDWLGSLNR